MLLNAKQIKVLVFYDFFYSLYTCSTTIFRALGQQNVFVWYKSISKNVSGSPISTMKNFEIQGVILSDIALLKRGSRKLEFLYF